MKPLVGEPFDRWRLKAAALIFYGTAGNESCGIFVAEHNRQKLRIIAATGYGWEHLSVSLQKRCPTWEEMDWTKRQFFHPHEVVIQIHPAESDHISVHPHCLHLWRPVGVILPLPPKAMIG